MCNQNSNVQSVNLQTAVLMQVQEFVQAGKQFSRFEITLALRDKCNNNLLEIPEVEDTTPGARYRFDIRKDAVDVIFEQLYSNCLVNGLPPLNYRFDRVNGYRVFFADPTAAPTVPVSAQPAVPPVSVDPTGANQIVAAVAAATVPQSPMVSVPSSVLNDSEIRRRVTLYMDRCKTLGVTPTLKQIQSAIKRGKKSTGLSYNEISNVVTSLGYKV